MFYISLERPRDVESNDSVFILIRDGEIRNICGLMIRALSFWKRDYELRFGLCVLDPLNFLSRDK